MPNRNGIIAHYRSESLEIGVEAIEGNVAIGYISACLVEIDIKRTAHFYETT